MEITKVDIQFNDNKYLHCYEYEKLWGNLTSFSVGKKDIVKWCRKKIKM